jgi:hypothetical protein
MKKLKYFWLAILTFVLLAIPAAAQKSLQQRRRRARGARADLVQSESKHKTNQGSPPLRLRLRRAQTGSIVPKRGTGNGSTGSPCTLIISGESDLLKKRQRISRFCQRAFLSGNGVHNLAWMRSSWQSSYPKFLTGSTSV